MLTIRFGLEEDLNARPAAEMMQAEWSVKLACAWLAYGSAMPLLSWAQENLDDGNVEHQTNSFAPGPLYHGPAIVCFERWQFWLHRLDELANQESGRARRPGRAPSMRHRRWRRQGSRWPASGLNLKLTGGRERHLGSNLKTHCAATEGTLAPTRRVASHGQHATRQERKKDI